ncbi:MAG TPA: ComF family protein [Gemmatimonadaceae bacterium]|nr:ComF family protein [Gemmatimonadaceae bacterium]
MARFAWEVLAALLSPDRCSACDGPVERLAAFCTACGPSAVTAPPESADQLAAFLYGGAVAHAVSRMKYDGRADLARPLGDLLARALDRTTDLARDFVVVPVPLHPLRLAERGFNPACLVARRVARYFSSPFFALALRRTRPTQAQATLNRDGRLANVRGAFAVRRASAVARRHVLLIDDVRTTGSTLDACAAALREAGAVAVTTAVVARADRGAVPARARGGPMPSM